MSVASLLNKKELFVEQIFPKLKWNDLLRFRRVSKDTKKLSDEYIKENGGLLCPEITIYEQTKKKKNHEKTLESFLQLGFPTSSIHLMNISGIAMFQNESKHFIKFLEEFGSKILHVHVIELSSSPSGMEKKFYEGLPNLESLRADTLEISKAAIGYKHLDDNKNPLPKTFKNLKKLILGVARWKKDSLFLLQRVPTSRSIIEYCENLNYAADAFIAGGTSKIGSTPGQFFETNVMEEIMRLIKEDIERRGKKAPSKPILKFYDFVAFNEDEMVQHKLHGFRNAPHFLKLADVCLQNSVKLLNVNAAWLQDAQLLQPQQVVNSLGNHHDSLYHKLNQFGDLVVSLVNMHGMVVDLELRNMEKLTILGTSQCCLFPGIWKETRKSWPALKTLDMTVDSKLLYTMLARYDAIFGQATCLDGDTTASLMKCLFVGIQRPALVDVSLKFKDGVDVEESTLNAACCVGSCCPNLKKLSLSNWPGDNMTLVKMWGEMKNLEELTLEKCKLIGNLAFVKTDTTTFPGMDFLFKMIGNLAFTNTDTTVGIFLQLNRLKKISLLGLDQMPKITDTLFKDVLSQMELTHLILSSDKPLTNVTPNGIRALKDGIFAQSIERFPFQGWSLAKQSKKDFKQLEKEFRSYNML